MYPLTNVNKLLLTVYEVMLVDYSMQFTCSMTFHCSSMKYCTVVMIIKDYVIAQCNGEQVYIMLLVNLLNIHKYLLNIFKLQNLNLIKFYI